MNVADIRGLFPGLKDTIYLTVVAAACGLPTPEIGGGVAPGA